MVNDSQLFNLAEISDSQNLRLFQFLDYIQRILNSTGAPYVRDMVTVDYLTSTLQMNYETAEKFLHQLIDENLLAYDQHGAFPGSILTVRGKEILSKLRPIFGHKSAQNSEAYIPQKRMIVWGNTQDLTAKAKLKNLDISEGLIYRFLKFHLGVIKSTQVPYLRELVAEDFLKDMENMSFKQANDFIAWMVEEGLLVYDQFGAFPGTGVTSKGQQLFDSLHQNQKKKET